MFEVQVISKTTNQVIRSINCKNKRDVQIVQIGLGIIFDRTNHYTKIIETQTKRNKK